MYCNAGHNPPYILKSNGEVKALPMAEDPMVGAIEGVVFHEATAQLEQGDSLLMFTDGVTEAMNVNNEEFGEERLEDTLAGVTMSTCQQMIDTVKSDVAAFTQGAEQSDDITILALKRL
jgi:sigma-B regulation protein RsbU (phosphoserine phosphatase)